MDMCNPRLPVTDLFRSNDKGRGVSMSRQNPNVVLALALVCVAPLTWAQTDPNAGMDSIASAGVRDSTMIDLTLPSVNDPAAVEMLFKEGNTIASILEGLKEKGFNIRYKEKHFLPSMTLLALPESTRIDEVLREILEPWNFRVYRSPLGHWIVTPNKKKATPAPRDETHEALKDIIRKADQAQ